MRRQLSACQPVAIDILFSFLSSNCEGDIVASVRMKFGVTCHNDSTEDGWYVTSPLLSPDNLQAYAESIGLDLGETDSSSASSLVSYAFQLHDIYAATSNHTDRRPEFPPSCFYVEVDEEQAKDEDDSHSSPFRFKIHLFHGSLNTRGIFFSWSAPAYKNDTDGHIGKRFMSRFMTMSYNGQQTDSILGDKEEISHAQERLRQWYDRYQLVSTNQESAKKNLSLNQSTAGCNGSEGKEATLEEKIPTGHLTESHAKLAAPEDEKGTDTTSDNGRISEKTSLVSSAAVIIVKASSTRNRKRSGQYSNSLPYKGARKKI